MDRLEPEDNRTPPRADPPKVTNFKSGEVCERSSAQAVCVETEAIEIEGKDRCEFDGQMRRCTWFGFEFDYENAHPDVKIECAYTRSHPSNEGNRDGVRERNATTGTLEVKLPAESGHFVHPMYQLHAVPPAGVAIIISTDLECSYAGHDLFGVRYDLRFPP